MWGSGGPLSLSAAPGHPPSLHPACATAAAEPSALSPPSTGVAAPAHWDDKGAQPGARVGSAPGLLAILLGMGGSWSLGVSPGVAAGLLQLQGVREVRSGRGCRRGLSHIPEPPSAGTRWLLSRTVNTLCATFFSGTLGAGGGEREAGVRPETFLYTTNFLYIFNFAAT